jgi:hypothetical protein
MAARTRKCKCGHTWNEHDLYEDRKGNKLIVCEHLERDPSATGLGIILCACKNYEEDASTEVSVPSAS